MVNFFKSDTTPVGLRNIASSLRRLGWVGFWFQVVLGVIPIVVLIIKMFSGQSQINTPFGLFLTFVCLLALLLTMYWSFHYVRLGRKLKDADLRFPKGAVIQSLWIGLTINIVGMICAVLIGMGRLATLTFNMLTFPQGATVITSQAQNNVINRTPWIAPSDMIILQAIINTIAAELVGIIIAILLLNKMMQHLHSTQVQTNI